MIHFFTGKLNTICWGHSKPTGIIFVAKKSIHKMLAFRREDSEDIRKLWGKRVAVTYGEDGMLNSICYSPRKACKGGVK